MSALLRWLPLHQRRLLLLLLRPLLLHQRRLRRLLLLRRRLLLRRQQLRRRAAVASPLLPHLISLACRRCRPVDRPVDAAPDLRIDAHVHVHARIDIHMQAPRARCMSGDLRACMRMFMHVSRHTGGRVADLSRDVHVSRHVDSRAPAQSTEPLWVASTMWLALMA